MTNNNTTTTVNSCLNTEYCVCYMCSVDAGLAKTEGEEVYDNTLDKYGDTTVLEDVELEMHEGKPIDAMGDLPNYDEMTLEEYVAKYWYSKAEYAEDGCHRRVPTFMHKRLVYQDGGHRGQTKESGDMFSEALNKLAYSESSMFKVSTEATVAKVRKLITLAAEADSGQIHDTLKCDALELVMEDKRAKWAATTNAKMAALDELEPQVVEWLKKDARRMSILELFSRVVSYADKVNEANLADRQEMYEYRSRQGDALMKAVQGSLYVHTGWYMPRYVSSYVGKLYWAKLTNRLHGDVDEAANVVVVPNDAVVGCTSRYVWAILNQVRLDRSSEDGHVDNMFKQ